MRDALRACLSELKHGGTKSTETHGGVGDTVGPADRTRRVWCRPEATIGAPGSSCVFVSSVAPCFNLLRTRSGSQLIPDRTSARVPRSALGRVGGPSVPPSAGRMARVLRDGRHCRSRLHEPSIGGGRAPPGRGQLEESMSIKIGINGFGRIGRNVLRAAAEMESDLEVVAINDIGDPRTFAHLLKHDTAMGTFGPAVEARGDEIVVGGRGIRFLSLPEIGAQPWGELGAEFVIESTGHCTDGGRARAHIDRGG